MQTDKNNEELELEIKELKKELQKFKTLFAKSQENVGMMQQHIHRGPTGHTGGNGGLGAFIGGMIVGGLIS